MIDLKLFSSLFDNNLPIYIGYSGGMDSHALLSLCARARDLNYISANLVAIHVNHGISPNADYWQEHCKKICHDFKIDFISRKIELIKPTEELARKARLAQFKKIIGDTPHNLLFAHHALDQAETILFRLFRGTGIDGIVGMQSVSYIEGLKIVRPLLHIDKPSIIQYSQDYNLQYIVDESNLVTKYSRNYIRNNIIPLIQERWPKAITNINNFAKHCGDVKKIVDNGVGFNTDSDSLSISYLEAFEKEAQQHILAKWLRFNNVSLSVKHVDVIFRQVINARYDAQPQLQISNKYIVRSFGYLYVLDQISDPTIYECLWDSKHDLNLDFLNFKLKSEDFNNEELLVKVGSYGQKIKKIFQENKIPVWERHRCILIYKDQSLIKIVNSLNNKVIYNR